MQAEHSGAAEAVLATLPAHTSSPMLWASEERREMLQGSPALEEAEQLEADVRGEWASISSAAEASSNPLTSRATLHSPMSPCLEVRCRCAHRRPACNSDMGVLWHFALFDVVALLNESNTHINCALEAACPSLGERTLFACHRSLSCKT